MSIPTSPMSSSSSSLLSRPYWQFGVQVERDDLYSCTTEPSLSPFGTVSNTETLGQEYSGAIEVVAVLEVTLVPLPANGYETLLQQAHTQPFAAPQNDGYENTQRSCPSERNTIPEYPMGATPLSSTRLSTSSPVWPSSIKFTDSGSVSSCRLPSAGYLNDEFLVSENLSNFVSGSLCQLENSISRSASTYEELSGDTEHSLDSSVSAKLVYRKLSKGKSANIANTSFTTIPTRPIPNTLAEISPFPRHHCPWTTCTSSFGRAADRNRHFITKHGGPVKYFCPISDCSRGRGLWKGYSREDKVVDHVKKVHVHAKF